MAKIGLGFGLPDFLTIINPQSSEEPEISLQRIINKVNNANGGDDL